jgi:hypothetical protein
VLASEDPGHLAEVAERGHAELDRLAEVVGVPRQRGPELVHDQAQALPERFTERVRDQVELDGLRDPAGGDRGPVGERLALRVAVDEVLGDQRLRLRGAGGAIAEHR